MIAIINQGKRNDKGETLYVVKINNTAIATFYHHRSDGLVQCLKSASEAVDIEKVKKIAEMMSEKNFDLT